MDASQVQTLKDLGTFVSALVEQQEKVYQGSLEEYLRALWKLIQGHQDDTVTFALLAELFQNAFTTVPLPFDKRWLVFSNPPSLDEDHEEFILDDFAVLHQMICYQIADLHLMAQAEMLDQPYIILGVDSPTGHRWFNFDPCTYLRCAVQPIGEGEICTWETLSILLWLGQIYE